MTTYFQPNTRDPVCGMAVDPRAAKYTTTHHDVTWNFCAQGCLNEFLKDPERFAGQPISSPQPLKKRFSLKRELLWATIIFVMIAALVVVVRGLTNAKSKTALNNTGAATEKTTGSGPAADKSMSSNHLLA